MAGVKTAEDKFSSMTLHQHFNTGQSNNIIPRPKMVTLGGKFNNIVAIHDEVAIYISIYLSWLSTYLSIFLSNPRQKMFTLFNYIVAIHDEFTIYLSI